MNRTFRSLFVLLLGAGAVTLAAACSSSSGNAPSTFGEACSVYAVGQACVDSLVCRCDLELNFDAGVNTCFCTQPCTVPDDCPNDAGSCSYADDPSALQPIDGLYCFNFLPDGGPLQRFGPCRNSVRTPRAPRG